MKQFFDIDVFVPEKGVLITMQIYVNIYDCKQAYSTGVRNWQLGIPKPLIVSADTYNSIYHAATEDTHNTHSHLDTGEGRRLPKPDYNY